MLNNCTRYVFAPDRFLQNSEDADTGQTYYGWTWNNISIVVGCLPSDVARKRVEEINKLKLQLVGVDFSPLSPLIVLGTSSLMSSNTKSPVWITYRAPNLRAHRFYTVDQLQLDLVSRVENTSLSSSAVQLNAVIGANPTPLELPGARNVPPMDVVLDHINISPTVDQLVQGTLKTSQLLVPAGLGQISSHATVAPPWSWLSNLTRDLIIIPLVFLAGVCNASMPISYSGSTLAKDISATLQQTDVRLEQLLNSKEQFEATRLERVQSVALSVARYINFFNCVWLIFNDVIIGIAVGGFICDNKDILSRLTLQLMQRYFVDSLSETLHWLNNWPVGLKLNTELSHFLCNSFATIIDYWTQVMHLAAPYFPFAVYCIGSSGVLGMTMILSLTSDFLSILTSHIYFCYLLATTVFARLLNLLGSLYNLFRGKRKNILRNRTDSWNYDMDQLLLGTILFTLVTFLLPTVTVYYLLFTLARLAIIGMQASLETILAFLNHFPLFALMLRVKDPARLPGGIELRFKPIQFATTKNAFTTNLKLVNKPVPFSRIFFQYLTVWSRLSSHYSPIRLLRCLLTGTFINPISRYSIRFGLPSSKAAKIKVV